MKEGTFEQMKRTKLPFLIFMISMVWFDAATAQDSVLCQKMKQAHPKLDLIVQGPVVRGGVKMMSFRDKNFNAFYANHFIFLKNDTNKYYLLDTVDLNYIETCSIRVAKPSQPIYTYNFQKGTVTNHRSQGFLNHITVLRKNLNSKGEFMQIEAEGKVIANPYYRNYNRHPRYAYGHYLFVFGPQMQDTLPLSYYNLHPASKENPRSKIIGFHDQIRITQMQLSLTTSTYPKLEFTKETKIELLQVSNHYTNFQKKIGRMSFNYPQANNTVIKDTILSKPWLIVEKEPAIEGYNRTHFLVQSLHNGLSAKLIQTDTILKHDVGDVIRIKVGNFKYPNLYFVPNTYTAEIVPTNKRLDVEKHLVILDTLRKSNLDLIGSKMHVQRAVFNGFKHTYRNKRNVFNVMVNGRQISVFIKNHDKSKLPRYDLGDELSFSGITSGTAIDVDSKGIQCIKPAFSPNKNISALIESSLVENFRENDSKVSFQNFDLILYNYKMQMNYPDQPYASYYSSDTVEIHENVFNSMNKRVLRIRNHQQGNNYKLFYNTFNQYYNKANKQDESRIRVYSDFIEIPMTYWNVFQIPKQKQWPQHDPKRFALSEALRSAILPAKSKPYHLGHVPGEDGMTLKVVRLNKTGEIIEEKLIYITFSYGC